MAQSISDRPLIGQQSHHTYTQWEDTDPKMVVNPLESSGHSELLRNPHSGSMSPLVADMSRLTNEMRRKDDEAVDQPHAMTRIRRAAVMQSRNGELPIGQRLSTANQHSSITTAYACQAGKLLDLATVAPLR